MTFFEVTAKSAFGSRKVDQEGFEPYQNMTKIKSCALPNELNRIKFLLRVVGFEPTRRTPLDFKSKNVYQFHHTPINLYNLSNFSS